MPHDMLRPITDESLALRAFDIFRRRASCWPVRSSSPCSRRRCRLRCTCPTCTAATAVVLVERPVPEVVRAARGDGELESRLHVIKQEILSRDPADRARSTRSICTRSCGNAIRMDAVLDQMRHDIEIELTGPEQVSGRKTTVSFKLSYTGASGETVADVTNALAAFYVAAERRASDREEATRTTEFLRAQLEATRKELDRHERAMRAYTTSHPGELPQQVDVNLAALERLNTQLRLNGERQLKLLEDREKLSDGVATVTVDAATGEQLAAAQPRIERIERMKRELQILEGQFTSRYPDVVRLRTEIAGRRARAGATRWPATWPRESRIARPPRAARRSKTMERTSSTG